MYFPPSRVDYSTADMSRFDTIRNAESAVGFYKNTFYFTKEFKFRCSITHSLLTSEADAATSAFCALENVLANFSVGLRVIGRIYSALVSSILVYGGEAWCLQEVLFNCLRSFQLFFRGALGT